MDIKAYIESGILEQYVIGTLAPAEHAAVEKNILLYPELASEVESIEIALETYAKHQGRKPKLTEDQLIQNLHKTHPVSSNQAKSSVSKSSSWPTYLLGILAVGLLGYIIFQNNRVSESRQLNQRLQFTLDSLRNQCTQTEFQNNILFQKLNLLNEAGSKFLKLPGTALSPQSFASVIIDSTGKKLFFDFAGLPKPPTGKQFQLWAIQDGKPVNMGVVSNDLIGSVNFSEKTFIDHAQAFAVTLEDEGGKASPTLEQLYVIGNVL